MAELDPVLLKVDSLISQARLDEIAFLLATERATRIARIAQVVATLHPGSYLLGTGTTNAGILPLTVGRVVLGRMATPLEEPSDTVVDHLVTDTFCFGPREASRTHAAIERRGGGFYVRDLKSTRGTQVNGESVEPEGEGRLLEHGDVITLGSSRVTAYVFFVVAAVGQ